MLAKGDPIVNVLSVSQTSTASRSSGSTAPAPSHSITTSTSSTVQTSTHTPSINTSPFFPQPSTLNPQPNPQQWSQNLAKTVVTFLIVILVAIMIFIVAFKRYRYLRRTSQPLRHFFPWPWRRLQSTTDADSSASSPMLPQTQTLIQPPSNSRTRFRPHPMDYTAYVPSSTPPLSSRHMTAIMDDDVRYPITAASLALPQSAYIHPSSHLYPYPQYIATQMLHSRSNRTRTRAAGTDAQGRRLDSGWDPDQFDFEAAGGHAQGAGGHEDKEMLPAYDCYGGPPKYIDVQMEVYDVEAATRTTNATYDGNDTMTGDGNGNAVNHQDRILENSG